MRLAVVGCGKMGLPLAAQAASKGNTVIGVDVDPRVVDAINEGRCPIDEAGVDELVARAAEEGRLSATRDMEEALSEVEAVIVIVPVKLTAGNRADLSIILDVTESISRSLKPGLTVSYETTLPVGTTGGVLCPILEKSGLRVEEDFYLVFSPERVKSRRVMANLNSVPKIVGGAGERSVQKGLELYRSILDARVVNIGSLEHAEALKIAGMVYRDVNIALVNELSRYFEHYRLDVLKIIEHANTDGETSLLIPGIGVGGHCTPVYPHFLLQDSKSKGVPQFLANAARFINDGQAEYFANKAEDILKGLKGKKVLLLGLAFRPSVKEDSYSTAYLMERALRARGAAVYLYDPLYTPREIEERGFIFKDINALDGADAAVLITAHGEFAHLDWRAFSRAGVKLLIDGRNFIDPEDVTGHGIVYIGVGR